MKLSKQSKQSLKSVAAIAIALFYIVNVQSVNEVPKQFARQNELDSTVMTNKEIGELEGRRMH